MNMENIISSDPLILDYSQMSDEGFEWMHITPILRVPDDISQGVEGLCRAGAFGRLLHVLSIHDAPVPQVVKVIKDPEAELTYELR